MPHRWSASNWSLLPSVITGSSAGSVALQLRQRGVEVVERLQRRGIDAGLAQLRDVGEHAGRLAALGDALERALAERLAVVGPLELLQRLRRVGLAPSRRPWRTCRAAGSGRPSRARRRAGSPGCRRTTSGGLLLASESLTCLIQLAKSRKETLTVTFGYFASNASVSSLIAFVRALAGLGGHHAQRDRPEVVEAVGLDVLRRRLARRRRGLLLAWRPAARGDDDRQHEQH